jgi:hypothetical protein
MLGLARACQLSAASGSGGAQLSPSRYTKARRVRAMAPIAANSERPSKQPEGDEPLDEDGEPLVNPLERPLYQPLYRPLREPLHGT